MTTYLRKRKIGRQALGSLASGGLGSLGDDLASTITTVTEVANDAAGDPYLNEMLCHVKQLGQISKGQPVSDCIKTPLGMPGGIGLKYAVVPMRAFVFAQQYPIAYVAIAAVLIGLPVLVGYQMGKRSK